MGLFNRKVWRNGLGEIACPGDSCKAKCDDKCPIWINTTATELLQRGMYYDAIKRYKLAIEIAPDMSAAWNNMGHCYGQLGDHEKAYSAYKKAYELGGKASALLGLAISLKNCGKYSDCIYYCNLYQNKFKDHQADQVKEEAFELRHHKSANSQGTAKKESSNSTNTKKTELQNTRKVEKKTDTNNSQNQSITKREFSSDKDEINFDLRNKIIRAVSASMYEAKMITKKNLMIISHSSDIWESLVTTHMFNRELRLLKSEDFGSFLFACGMHAFGAGIYVNIFQTTVNKPIDEFGVDEDKKILDTFAWNDAYKLGLEQVGISPDSKKKNEIDDVIIVAINTALKEVGKAADKPENLSALMSALYDAGMTYYVESNNPENQKSVKSREESIKSETINADNIKNTDTSSEDIETNEEKLGKAWLYIAGKDKREEGFKLLRELSSEGLTDADVSLAMFTSDQNERMKLVKKAALNGNSEGMWQYASLLPRSYVPDRNNAQDKEWEKWCTLAAKGGSADAMNELGNTFNRRNEYAESMYWYVMANANDHPAGQLSLQGIAKKWANAGAPRKYVKTSEEFTEGRFKVSLSYLEMWANMKPTLSMKQIQAMVLVGGNPIAGYRAADQFESEDDYESAYAMFNATAFDYDAHAIRCCADMCIRGLGVEQDTQKAGEMYLMAANLGNRTAMFILGRFAKKKELAAYWYAMAHIRGYEYAYDELVRLAN